MGDAQAGLTPEERAATLRALCDTVVCAVAREDDVDGFWARTASDLNVEAGVELLLSMAPPIQRDGASLLLCALHDASLAATDGQDEREAIIRAIRESSPAVNLGVAGLISMIQFLAYGAPDPTTGRNPNWDTLRYPGPPAAAAVSTEKPITPYVPRDGETIDADVCIVGSGAGGSVIAGMLAQAGLGVVVLEAAGYYTASDFTGYEMQAYQDMYWRGGPQSTAEGNVTILAGAALGGGTVINWTNCLRTPDFVRREWAHDHGLEGLDTPEFDRHLDAVLARIGATDRCSDLNGPQQRMKEGADALGLSFKTVVRNTDPATYDPESAGHIGFGDRSGSKLSTDKTYLLDAHAAGAKLIVRCRAQRLVTQDGHAAAVEAVVTDPATGASSALTVRAPRIVVAAGAMESPALLLRSGIGGPAVGDHFRVHTCTATLGVYQGDQKSWWGAPHAGLIDSYQDPGDGYGFLIEATQYAPGLIGSGIWPSGVGHKELIARFHECASFIALTRDHGHGRVTIDGDGEPVVSYPVDDPVDLANLRRGLEAQIRLHVAAGATEVYSLAAGVDPWREGEDLEAWIQTATAQPMRAGGQRLFAAHEMGSCRMGADPQTSVANPWGELHDTAGVWIGDGSAFPTTSGVNPMVSIMALAHRTAAAIAADAGVAEPVAVA